MPENSKSLIKATEILDFFNPPGGDGLKVMRISQLTEHNYEKLREKAVKELKGIIAQVPAETIKELVSMKSDLDELGGPIQGETYHFKTVDERFVTFSPSKEDWELFLEKWAEMKPGGMGVDMTLNPTPEPALDPGITTSNVDGVVFEFGAPIVPAIGFWMEDYDGRTMLFEKNTNKSGLGMPFAESLPEGEDYDLHRRNSIEMAEDNAKFIKEHGLEKFILRYSDPDNLPDE